MVDIGHLTLYGKCSLRTDGPDISTLLRLFREEEPNLECYFLEQLQDYKLETTYNFRLTHSVPGLVKHRSNFPKFAVSPENLVTSQTAFVAPCWFPYSAFLEVTSARPSSGLSASTCGPPACARGVTAPSVLRTSHPSGTEAGRLVYPKACAFAGKPPREEPGS